MATQQLMLFYSAFHMFYLMYEAYSLRISHRKTGYLKENGISVHLKVLHK